MATSASYFHDWDGTWCAGHDDCAIPGTIDDADGNDCGDHFVPFCSELATFSEYSHANFHDSDGDWCYGHDKCRMPGKE